jgi:uncharacterized protein (DUF1501 family)
MIVNTRLTRREFLKMTGLVTFAATVPQFLVELARASTSRPIPGFRDDKVLVVVHLAGGNDGLNTVVPYVDDAYYRARPTLGIKKENLLKIDDKTGFHASLAPLKALYDKGLVTVVEGVGYPNPNRSHFRSTEIWYTASDSDVFRTTGWIGNYLDQAAASGVQPVAALAVSGERPQAFFGKRGLGVAVANPQRFGWQKGPGGATLDRFKALNNPSSTSSDSVLEYIRHVATDAVVSADIIAEVAKRGGSEAKYSADAFSGNMRTVAQLIGGDLPTRIFFLSFSGFDTHANQAPTQARLLEQFASGISAFWQDMEVQGNASRVLVLVFSEFGRRVAENASGGTDHGTAEPVFLIGKGLRGGFAGKRPSLTDLDAGDLKFTTDFRSVYATILETWLGTDSKKIMGRSFPRLPLFQNSQS